MKQFSKRLMNLIIPGVLLGFATPVFGQDPIKANPDMYKVLVDNDEVRIYEGRFMPGAKAATHTHANKHYVYAITNATMTITPQQGEARTLNVKAGEVIEGQAETHSSTNSGTTEVRLLIIEPKGMSMKKEGDKKME